MFLGLRSDDYTRETAKGIQGDYKHMCMHILHQIWINKFLGAMVIPFEGQDMPGQAAGAGRRCENAGGPAHH